VLRGNGWCKNLLGCEDLVTGRWREGIYGVVHKMKRQGVFVVYRQMDNLIEFKPKVINKNLWFK
jgi:hypothetical protein